MEAQRFGQILAVVTLVLLVVVRPAWAEQKAFAYELKQEWPLTLPKGTTVILKIPLQFWLQEKEERRDFKIELPFQDERSESVHLRRPYFVDMQNLFNRVGWAASGFPHCGEFTLSRIFEFRSFAMHHKLPYTEVELRSNTIYLRLHFAHSSSEVAELNSDFQKVVFQGTWQQFEKTEDFQRDVFAVQEAKIFTGPIAGLSDGVKLSLMDMACAGQNTFGAETYKGRSYFAVILGSDGQVYNSNVMNSSARVARVVNEQIIDRVKTFKGPAQQTGIDGLKFEARVSYRNFVNEPEIRDDQLEIYLPLDLCVKFVDADITSQQLIDGSIVLLNGNRIQVPLSSGG
jgi:hypothetical protein